MTCCQASFSVQCIGWNNNLLGIGDRHLRVSKKNFTASGIPSKTFKLGSSNLRWHSLHLANSADTSTRLKGKF